MLKYSVGLDISSKKISCCMVSIDSTQSIKVKASCTINNTLKGFEHLEAWVKKHRKDVDVPLFFCMEATGIYYESCALHLQQKGYHVSVVLPNLAKKYMDSIGQKSKNDSIDAKGLASMGAERKLKAWSPMGTYFYKLRGLTRQHQNLQEQKTVANNQLEAVKRGMYRQLEVEKQLKATIALFDRQLKSISKLMEEQLAQDEVVKGKVENICEIKGVGVLTVATIIGETNGFELFESAGQLVSYSGYDVVENQSGKHTGKTRISKRGNSRIRRALHMPALNAVRYEERVFKAMFERTFERHKIKMKSYVAVQKKLLTTIYALWKRNEKFDSNYGIKGEQAEDVSIDGVVLLNGLEKGSPTQGGATQGKVLGNTQESLPLS